MVDAAAFNFNDEKFGRAMVEAIPTGNRKYTEITFKGGTVTPNGERVAVPMGQEIDLVITADHGCDPTTPGSDHTREHIPMIFFGPGVAPRALGVSETFSDIGQTLAHHLGVKPLSHGSNLL